MPGCGTPWSSDSLGTVWFTEEKVGDDADSKDPNNQLSWNRVLHHPQTMLSRRQPHDGIQVQQDPVYAGAVIDRLTLTGTVTANEKWHKVILEALEAEYSISSTKEVRQFT